MCSGAASWAAVSGLGAAGSRLPSEHVDEERQQEREPGLARQTLGPARTGGRRAGCGRQMNLDPRSRFLVRLRPKLWGVSTIWVRRLARRPVAGLCRSARPIFVENHGKLSVEFTVLA